VTGPGVLGVNRAGLVRGQHESGPDDAARKADRPLVPCSGHVGL